MSPKKEEKKEEKRLIARNGDAEKWDEERRIKWRENKERLSPYVEYLLVEREHKKQLNEKEEKRKKYLLPLVED
jgi:hypothetical protein